MQAGRTRQTLALLLDGQSADLRASPVVAARLRPFWPEIRFTRWTPRRPVASLAAEAPRGPAGLVFGQTLLRPPRLDAPWSSATVIASRDPSGSGPSLGGLAALRPMSAAALAQGAAMAAGVLAAPSPASPNGSPVGEFRLLVQGHGHAEDLGLLRRLLLAGDAAGLVVAARAGSALGNAARRAGCVTTDRRVDAWPLVAGAREVHAPPGSDHALLAGFAGRPVLHDGKAAEANPAMLAAAYLVLGARYVDPATGGGIDCLAALDQFTEWRRLAARLPQIGCLAGVSFWKRPALSAMLGGRPAFARTARAAVAAASAHGGGVAVWPSRAPPGLDALAARAGVPVWRIEDGFIRSAGLGADFIPPASVVIDSRGIYYDPGAPSDLEHLLAETTFDAALLARARQLIDLLVARRVTKYGLGDHGPAFAVPHGRRSILVPGQVADDRSVLAGGCGIGPGIDLLRRVRAAEPDAFIAYKPHPDVDAGHRRGAVPDAQIRQYADAVVRGASMATLLGQIDAVHTLTSLAGFEALLRRLPVTTYGQPFYAGWGLSIDRDPPAKRARTLTLEELVAGTLILYPHYMDPRTCLPCSPEQLIERLTARESRRAGPLVWGRRLQGAVRRRLAA